ncbi:unnamed protein product [Caenorhabditis angaria]|uniref:J domain-containing protein n=1 Tax=Caenorhabditis angaria TaxID=860376 RepID=A0A9P1MRZ8_9PELO|nr:unnamed protein product [Caenorhabditis angaria]
MLRGTRTKCLCINRTSTSYSSFSTRPNHYEILGVPQNASIDQIKSAFYEKSKKLHPDNQKDGKKSTSQFVELKTAYDILRRPADRRLYDYELKNGIRPGAGRGGGNAYNSAHPQYDFSRGWSAEWASNDSARKTREERDKSSKDFMKSILKWTGIGLAIVVLYNGGYVYMLSWNQKQLDKLVDEDEIAKCFLRQREVRDGEHDVSSLGRILKADIDEAWKMRCEQEKNPDEIREEYRWFRALQDADHIRSLKEKRMERKIEERNKWRNE